MYPFASSPRAALGSASGNALAAPSRPAWRLWLVVALLLVAGLVALGAGARPEAVPGSGLRSAAAVAPATLDGFPPAPLSQPLHQLGIAEPDGETGRSARPAAATPADWPARAGRNDALLATSRAIAPPVVGQPYRTPPAHAPPAGHRS